jgi:hypothetical protein
MSASRNFDPTPFTAPAFKEIPIACGRFVTIVNRQSTIVNQQSSINNRQSTIVNRGNT